MSKGGKHSIRSPFSAYNAVLPIVKIPHVGGLFFAIFTGAINIRRHDVKSRGGDQEEVKTLFCRVLPCNKN